MRAWLAFLVAGTIGCRGECEQLPPTFQLDIRSDMGVGSIEVIVGLDGQRHSRIYDLSGQLDDRETSLVVEVDPAPTADFEVDVSVIGYSDAGGAGGVVSSAQDRFSASADGCNRFSLDLAPGSPDGGVDLCDPRCGGAECTLACDGRCAACALTCAGAATACTSMCQGPSSCTIDCAGTGECQGECTGNSSCDINCANTVECKARCNGGANCRLDCSNTAECSFTVCAGMQTTCDDGSIVCNRECP